ncbi:MAG: ankyrin repeat domain-containing protein [Gammaproteobacteria bacterium]|nr:ankyrin repeat domain-containing protein [Gammaproteobacteria bacterium]
MDEVIDIRQNFERAISARNYHDFSAFVDDSEDYLLILQMTIKCAEAANVKTSLNPFNKTDINPWEKDTLEEMMFSGLSRMARMDHYNRYNWLRVHAPQEANKLKVCLIVINNYLFERNIQSTMNSCIGPFLFECVESTDEFEKINKVCGEIWASTSLYESIQQGLLTTVRKLLNAGKKVDRMDILTAFAYCRDSDTPEKLLFYTNYLSIVRLLLKNMDEKEKQEFFLTHNEQGSLMDKLKFEDQNRKAALIFLGIIRKRRSQSQLMYAKDTIGVIARIIAFPHQHDFFFPSENGALFLSLKVMTLEQSKIVMKRYNDFKTIFEIVCKCAVFLNSYRYDEKLKEKLEYIILHGLMQMLHINHANWRVMLSKNELRDFREHLLHINMVFPLGKLMGYSRCHLEVGRGRLGPVLIECLEWSDFEQLPVVKRDCRRYFNLMHAAQYGDANLFKILISSPNPRNRDVNKVDGQGFRALHYAVMNAHTEIVRLLLVHGAIVNQSTVEVAKNCYGENSEIFCLVKKAADEDFQRKKAATVVVGLGKHRQSLFRTLPAALNRQIAKMIVNPAVTMKAV